MAGRTVEAIKVDGIKEYLASTLLRADPESPPQGEQIPLVVETAREMLERAMSLLPNPESMVFTVLRWPAKGAANWGLLIAINPRSPVDRSTGAPFFVREFKDGEPGDELAGWIEADEAMVAYAVQQFGRPRLVE